MRNANQDNRFFKMGAAVAVGELFGLGRLGDGEEAASRTRGFLRSFGIKDMDDVESLGIKGPYVEELGRIYGCAD